MEYDSEDEFDNFDEDSLLPHEEPQSEENFLFGLSLHLGQASNNYAEYTAVIMGQLFFALFDQPKAHICTDS